MIGSISRKNRDYYYFCIRRALVIGGWLVESTKYDITNEGDFISDTITRVESGVGIMFVPDAQYK
ncbi:MAG: hypothetical protein HZR80_12470 [Candidatus Heimdallarchaeota archaeon]